MKYQLCNFITTYLFLAIFVAGSAALGVGPLELERELAEGEELANSLANQLIRDPPINDEVVFEQTLAEIWQGIVNKEQQEQDLVSMAKSTKRRFKRFTVDFNGKQVSYPTYVRLTKLQSKVMKLKRMIQLLNMRYTEQQLAELPQYAKLMNLYTSLRPLLPTREGQIEMYDLEHPESGEDHLDDHVEEEDDEDGDEKRSPFMMDFMGMRVTYPQYLRLIKLQEKVIKLDLIIRKMREKISIEQLERIPKWHTLLSLHSSLAKLLPPEHIAQFSGAQAERTTNNELNDDLASLASDATAHLTLRRRRRKRSTNFNDLQVNIPDYAELMRMQKSAMKLDAIMREMEQRLGTKNLEHFGQWDKLVSVRKALQKVMPEGFPEWKKRGSNMQKKAMTVEFNGVRVSYPQYVRLMSLQKKVENLDTIIETIKSLKTEKELEKFPEWKKLTLLRRSLDKLLPSRN